MGHVEEETHTGGEGMGTLLSLILPHVQFSYQIGLCPVCFDFGLNSLAT